LNNNYPNLNKVLTLNEWICAGTQAGLSLANSWLMAEKLKGLTLQQGIEKIKHENH
jgi:hypothetical protein